MTLIVGLQTRDGVVIASDSQGTLRHSHTKVRVQKVFRRGRWLVAGTGSYSGLYHYLRRIEPDEDLTDPAVQMRTMQRLRRDYRQHQDAEQPEGEEPAEVVLDIMIATGRELYTVSGDGNIAPAQRYMALGAGQELALFLLRQEWRAGVDEATAAGIARLIIGEVAAMNALVGGPVQWMDTLGGEGEEPE